MINYIKEVNNIAKDNFFNEILPAYKPIVLRGICKNWFIVNKGCGASNTFLDYLKTYDRGNEVQIFLSEPAIKGEFFYNDDLKGFNFKKIKVPFSTCLKNIQTEAEKEAGSTVYMGSTPVEKCAPGLMNNDLCPVLPASISPRLWLGNKTLVPPHYDISDNIAVVVAGRRKFTLFPPEQIQNLYPGPIEVTPAGQPMSMVSLLNPDLDKYPLYRHALDAAMVAELEPGDAIYIPPLWWHGVQALENVNGLINYWWNSGFKGIESPDLALIHSILTIGSLPEKEREAWRYFFDYYVFQTNGHPLNHLPPEVHGVLGKMTPQLYQFIKQYLHSRMKFSRCQSLCDTPLHPTG